MKSIAAVRRRIQLAWVLVLATSVGCGGGGGGGGTATSTVAVHAKVIASGFASPMMYAANPVDHTLAYVLERGGKVRLLINDALQAAAVLDISGTVVTDGECGLLGIAFDPHFSSNHYFYLHYDSGSPIQSRIVRYTLDSTGKTASGAFPIMSFNQTSFTNHKGGAINFGSDGLLYLGFGDGGSEDDPNNYAQDPTVFFGKILRIDPTGDDFPDDPNNNYAVPPTNPFVGVAGVRSEIWDFGVRNPFRWSFDAQTGGMLIGDVGQDSYEEADFEPAGKGHRNYGWRTREGLHATSNAGPVYFTPLTDPFYEYSHATGQCIIGGFVYRGSVLPATVKNRYFYGDYSSGKIWSIPFATGSTGEAVSTSLAAAMDHTATINASLTSARLSGPVSLNPDANGEIMVCDINTGSLLRLGK